MKNTLRNIKYILIAFLLISVPSISFADQKHVCKEIINSKVESREFITSKVSYGELKKQFVQQVLLDAVKQSLGAEIRSHSGMTLKIHR